MIYIIVSTDMLTMAMNVTCYSTKKEFETHKALAREHEHKDHTYEFGTSSVRHSFYEVPLLGKSQKQIALSITKACNGETISDVVGQIDFLEEEERKLEEKNNEE